jgi:hypothetical protein
MINLHRITDNCYGFKDDKRYTGWLDAFGSVQKALIDNTWRAGDWTVTATGTSPITASVLADAVALITTGANEYDGDNIQFTGSQFKLESGKPAYFGAKLTVSEATESDLLFGLCGVDTTLTNASASHAIAVGASGVFFSKLDAVTAINFKTYATATETNSASVGTLDTDAHIYEFYWDGVTGLTAYFDNVLVAGFSSVPGAVLTPSLCFRAGSSGAKTCTIGWMRAIQARA